MLADDDDAKMLLGPCWRARSSHLATLESAFNHMKRKHRNQIPDFSRKPKADRAIPADGKAAPPPQCSDKQIYPACNS